MVMAAGILWGCMGLFVRLLNGYGLYSIQLSSIRFIFGTTALCLFALIYDRSLFRIKLKDLWLFILAGVLGITCTSIFYFTTISGEGMGVAAVLMYLAPAIVTVLSRIFFGERFTTARVTACVLAVVGCALVSGVFSISGISLKYLFTGIMSAVCYGSYSIISKLILQRGYRPFTVTIWAFIASTAASLPFTDFPQILSVMSAHPVTILYGAALAVPICTAAYVLFTCGLKFIAPGKASVLASVEPVTAAVIGAAVFREHMDAMNILGVALVISSIAVMEAGRGSIFRRRGTNSAPVRGR